MKLNITILSNIIHINIDFITNLNGLNLIALLIFNKIYIYAKVNIFI